MIPTCYSISFLTDDLCVVIRGTTFFSSRSFPPSLVFSLWTSGFCILEMGITYIRRNHDRWHWESPVVGLAFRLRNGGLMVKVVLSYRAWGFAAGSSALGGVGMWYLLRTT